MKLKAKQTLRAQSVSELLKKGDELKNLLVKWNINKHTKPSKNVRGCTALRKEIAVIETIMRESRETKG